MNDNLKNAEQKAIISNYTDKLKQLVDGIYNSFLSNHSMVDFQQAIDSNTDSEKNGILSEIKNHLLLDRDQKDMLFTNYYNLLMDGLENVQDINEKNDIRRIVFNNLKDKKMFSDPYTVVELINNKFKEEMEEMKRQIAQKINQDRMKQQLEEEQQLQQSVKSPTQKPLEKERQLQQVEKLPPQTVEPSGIHKNTIPLEQSIKQNSNYNINKQVDDLSSVQTTHGNDVDNNIGYRSGNIFDQLAEEQMNAHDPQAYAYNLQQQLSLQENAYKPTFSPDDFYRYKNISNIITSKTNASINNEYNLMRNEIQNSKNTKISSDKINDKNTLELNKKNSNVLMNLLMQQQKMNKDFIKQAYNKTDKNINNSVGLNDDKIVDKNNLNSNTLEQQQI